MAKLASRRQVLKGALSVPVVSSAWMTALSTAVAGDSIPRLTHFVFDNRFAEAVATARSLANTVPLAETNGDMTDLWFHQLDAQWKRAPQALAGITTSQGLFVLETLAADHRMRVVHRAQRLWLREPKDPRLAAWMIAPRGSSQLFA